MSSKLHAYPQSGIQLKEFNQKCTWDFLEAEGGHYLDCSLSSGWLNKSMKRIIPDFDLPAVATLETSAWQESEVTNGQLEIFRAPSPYYTENSVSFQNQIYTFVSFRLSRMSSKPQINP